MVASLAAQLSKGVSLNASLLADRSRRKPTESYLFTSREADQHDLPSIYALGVNGLSKLKNLDTKFSKYDETLFSDAARDLDRTLQSESQNTELDRTLALFLRDLGPHLQDGPASKALEWVVRRFRVNEFNVNDVMALFLPYHESPHFAKMVSILHVKGSRLWSFLAPLKASGKVLPRTLLVEEMLSSVDMARFVTALLPQSLAAGRLHRTLIGFTASVTLEYLTRIKKVEEEIMAFLLPSVTRSFAADSNADCALAGCIALAAMSRRCRLTQEALVALVTEMIKGQQHLGSAQLFPLLVAVLGPQDQLDEFTDCFTDSLLRLSGAVDALLDCLQWDGAAEKLVLPLLPSLVRRSSQPASSKLLESLVSSSTAPTSLTERYILLLLEAIVRSTTDTTPPAFKSLAVVCQRHGAVFSQTSETMLRTLEDQNQRRKLETIIRSVAIPSSLSTSGDHGKWILASQAADASSRVVAVRELLKTLATSDVDPMGTEEVHDALRHRITDTNATVIGTLYSDSRTLLPIVSNMPFIESVSKTLGAPDVSRSIMRLHLGFITADFAVHNPDLVPAVFDRVCLPHLLFTKPRQKTAAFMWQSLRQSSLANYELLAGCMNIVFAQPDDHEISRSVEDMAVLNIAVVTRIAVSIPENIVTSNSYPRHLDTLLELLSSSDVHTIMISHLILRALLGQLSGEHRVDAAHRILMSMALESLDPLHAVIDRVTNLQEVISDEDLSKNVVLKPSSSGTKHRLQISILALCPAVQQPVDVKIDWLGNGPAVAADMRGKRFVEFFRTIYSLANSSSATPSLSTSILRALFVNLREQALLFLAGIWSACVQHPVNASNLPLIALFHGAAFLKAQAADEESPQDFQVILPSLLVAIQSKQQPVRAAAMDCVAIIAQISSSHTVSPTIYALDAVYGSSSDGLQYLDWSDFSRYIATLNSRREHFINDGTYLGVFQQETLRKQRTDSKKEVGYKRRILCYTISHAVVWSSLPARVALLNTLKNVPHRAKLQMLLPLIQQLLSQNSTHMQLDEERELISTCHQLLFESFDETTAPDLNEAGSESWTTFMRALRCAFTSSEEATYSLIREATVQQLDGRLFHLLTTERQQDICVVLLESVVTYPESQQLIKDILGRLLKDPTLMISLLVHFQPTGTDSSQRAPKRPKLVPEPEAGPTESVLRPITVLVEVLVAGTPVGSVELMSCSVDVLTKVFHTHASRFDANYLMQLLMSLLESIASTIPGNTILPPGSVRMDVLVELLRVADNPQTFNQALLLIASLARLAPEFVMQNVMPVFTFMGSNVFHRDDSYSFRVVQKTIESIVPVMIASLRAKHAGSRDLQIASREFLRVFTDAATHVPRHRRTQFFHHLVEVLGPDEFTVSVCLLLVDKAANRVVRQKLAEAMNSLSLPLSVLQANFKAAPFRIIGQLLQECSRLVLRISEPDTTVHDAFLEPLQDGEQASSISTRRQIQAILIFVDLVLQQSSRKGTTSDGKAVEESVQLLLGLANLDHGPTVSPEFSEISRLALKATGDLLRIISAVEFASAISTIIASNNPTIESGAMNLLASRLTDIAPKTRQEISPTISDVIERACDRLKNSQEVTALQAALKALRVIALTAVTGEIPALSKATPLILQVAFAHKTLSPEVLSCILPLSATIGPRILPFFRDVVGFCSDVLVEAEDLQNTGEHSRAADDAQAILIAQLSALSQFWGIDELARLAGLSLGTRPASLTLRKALAKRTAAKQLFPALFRVWSNMVVIDDVPWARREAFFDLFKRIARIAPREDVHEHLRQTFKLFLEAFEFGGKHKPQDTAPFEKASLAAFVEVVTKLNEAAFKPLFRRLFDWAFNDTTEEVPNRQITFCHILTALIKLLKGLITPYMGVVITPLTEALETYRKQSPRLWLSAIELFQTSLTLDEGAFWRTDKLRTLMPSLVGQFEICTSLHTGDVDCRQALKTCLSALAASTDDDSLLKNLHLGVLMKTRSEDAQVRLFTLECAVHLWNECGDKLMGFVSDVVTFIAESADDEHDLVAKEARKLKKAVESRCGSLEMLMQ